MVSSHSPRLVKTQALSDMDNVEVQLLVSLRDLLHLAPWTRHTHSELHRYTQGVQIDGVATKLLVMVRGLP